MKKKLSLSKLVLGVFKKNHEFEENKVGKTLSTNFTTSRSLTKRFVFIRVQGG